MSELEEKVERLEKVLLLTWKLAKAVKRAHNQVTRTFNGNFDVFEDKVNRNANNIDKIVETHNFQLIVKDQNNKISWYYGTDLVSGNDVLIICQVSGHKIEWLAASSNPHLLISLITNFNTVFEREMIMLGHIVSKEQIYTLECKYCGNTLAYFPLKGESIECNKCKYEQVVWN